MATIKSILKLIIKQKCIQDDCVWGARGLINAYVDILSMFDIPTCDEIGTNNHAACNGLLCPHCEFKRRWIFGRLLSWYLRRDVYDDGYIGVISHRVRSKNFINFASRAPGGFHDESMLRRFRRFHNLIGWKVSVDWDREAQEWVFIRVAVVRSEPGPLRKDVDLWVTTLEDYEPSDNPAVLDEVGVTGGLIESVMTIGNVFHNLEREFGPNDNEAPLLDAGAAFRQWSTQNIRFHLYSIQPPRDLIERDAMAMRGY